MTDDIAQRALDAIHAGDWAALRPLLHPYLHWTDASGATIRGRTKVLAALTAGAPAEPPALVELRDGQIYRWRERGRHHGGP